MCDERRHIGDILRRAVQRGVTQAAALSVSGDVDAHDAEGRRRVELVLVAGQRRGDVGERERGGVGSSGKTETGCRRLALLSLPLSTPLLCPRLHVCFLPQSFLFFRMPHSFFSPSLRSLSLFSLSLSVSFPSVSLLSVFLCRLLLCTCSRGLHCYIYAAGRECGVGSGHCQSRSRYVHVRKSSLAAVQKFNARAQLCSRIVFVLRFLVALCSVCGCVCLFGNVAIARDNA